ncbi:ATP-binding protein [Mucilaginibacter sp.]|uniref:sensor histidine kinase n=1 Tax=Mucilaginibacter sp. TaxID=1882438 RepID=UPI003B004041
MVNPSSLLLTFTAHDPRLCFAFDVSTKQFIYANAAFEAFFNIKFEQVSARILLKMIHPEDLDYLKDSYSSLKPGSFKNNIEFRMQLPQGKECYLKSSLLYDVQADGQDTKHILTGYLEDITAEKDHINKLNEYSNKKNSVLNILSHDLAGPLGSIQNLSALISRKTKLLEDEDIKKWLDLIEKISKKSINLIQEFVKQEFIESAGAALVKKRVNLVNALKSLVGEYLESEKQMSLKFDLQISNEPVFAEIDEAKFLQAISNLISNAVKFTPDDGKITIGLEEQETTVRITIADTGIGIPQKFHAGLFDKFNNACRTGLKGEPSVGLGMSIIKTIIDWHEGKIWFESEENNGSKFYIEIKKG